MMFRRRMRIINGKVFPWAAALLLGMTAAAAANMGTAVVPKQIIYPGEEISVAAVEEVDVTNPNLAGGYARTVEEVSGMVSTRTLLPGRTIALSGPACPLCGAPRLVGTTFLQHRQHDDLGGRHASPGRLRRRSHSRSKYGFRRHRERHGNG
jgi:hypothetical protein